MKTFFITTPIYYPNARPHVGSAYTTIVCDVIARYKRMCGYDVAFLTGTDEHGEKLRRAAEEAGVSPAEFVAEKRKLFTRLWGTLGIPEYSPENPAGYRFVHTSQNPDHVKSVHWMIRQAQSYKIPHCAQCEAYLEPGTAPESCPRCGGSVELRTAIFKRKYEGRYCVHDERYVSDSSEPANCDICGRPAELISEENYFFRLSAFEKPLLELYERHEKDPRQRAFVQPDYRLNEVKSFVRSGLRDISISRGRLKWGIPWPDDPNQVVYVWYDALTSYLTGIGFRGGNGSRESGVGSRNSGLGNEDFQKYWMDPDAEIVHMIGKDILRFHAVYWPAFLMAAGLRLPTSIFAHGWIYYEQDKMSKSKGNVVYPEPIVEALNSLGAPGNDALRYYLLRDTPFGQDASFSYEGLIQRYNSDLANDLGNLASRTVAMVQQYCDGRLAATIDPSVQLNPRGGTWDFRQDFDNFDLSSGLERVLGLVSLANKLIVQIRPWELAKTGLAVDKDKIKETLSTVTQVLRIASVLSYAVLPESAKRLWGQLAGHLRGNEQALVRLGQTKIDGALLSVLLAQDIKVGKPDPIFPRLDKATALAKLEQLAEADRKGHQPKGATVTVPPEEKSPTPNPESPVPSLQPPASSLSQISIDDFAKVEMRVGEIVSAERIPKADKLLKIMVDIGTEVRQVLAGIAQYYEPEKLVGMKVVVVTNLQPRKMRGLESNGMIVAASVGEEGKPVLVTFNEEVPKGARLK